MKLYHGSNMEIDQVDLAKCRPFKDFGPGFYTTVLEEQAWRMARRRVALEGCGSPTVTIFEVSDDLLSLPELHCRVFAEQPSVEWAVFVRNNRDRQFANVKSLECNIDRKYDIVVGPVADDTVGLLIRRFSQGAIDADSLKKGFSFERVTNQYAFHTPAALRYLKKVGVLHE